MRLVDHYLLLAGFLHSLVLFPVDFLTQDGSYVGFLDICGLGCFCRFGFGLGRVEQLERLSLGVAVHLEVGLRLSSLLFVAILNICIEKAQFFPERVGYFFEILDALGAHLQQQSII